MSAISPFAYANIQVFAPMSSPGINDNTKGERKGSP